ncbi:hypothetical protein LTR28_003848 [Elasticomyces elasticus]|nr:hypothetical protein LTR28_003848 [Elasticomyces elasticus]
MLQAECIGFQSRFGYKRLIMMRKVLFMRAVSIVFYADRGYANTADGWRLFGWIKSSITAIDNQPIALGKLFVGLDELARQFHLTMIARGNPSQFIGWRIRSIVNLYSQLLAEGSPIFQDP